MLLDLLYGALPAEFQSAFDVEESVRRLAAATERSIPYGELRDAAVGRVSEKRVALRRLHPRVSNSFKPWYFGRFRRVGGRVVLTGRFTPGLFPKVFMTVWLALVLAWTGTVLVYAKELWPAAAGLGMFAVVVAIIVWGIRAGRADDVPWLSELIREALSARNPQG